ncbi:hypothetical protein HanIR_Chr17g0891621 [Helianthus annuus]|nr:hypothetical protein HanIR_Chr17g0891621 [Helianthus annuus]
MFYPMWRKDSDIFSYYSLFFVTPIRFKPCKSIKHSRLKCLTLKSQTTLNIDHAKSNM